MVIHQYDVFLIQKTRPCLVISPNEMNESIQTIIIAPMTTKSHPYPTRIPVKFEKKEGWIVLDQIRTVDRKRLIKKLGIITRKDIERVKTTLQEMLVE